MRHGLALLGNALYAVALLFLGASIAESVAGSSAWSWTSGPVAGCLAIVLAVEIGRAVHWGRLAAIRAGSATLRGWAAIHPRRGTIGRWYHLSFHEPLTDPEQARLALSRLCGYRLQAGEYRLASIRPGLRRGRLGAWVTVVRASRSTRHWRCAYVRWVDDPNECWLLRSALQPQAVAAPAPSPVESPGALESMSGAELDVLLHTPSNA